MNSSPAVEIPTDLLERWRALQQLRLRRRAIPCDCQCRQCSSAADRMAGAQTIA